MGLLDNHLSVNVVLGDFWVSVFYWILSWCAMTKLKARYCSANGYKLCPILSYQSNPYLHFVERSGTFYLIFKIQNHHHRHAELNIYLRILNRLREGWVSNEAMSIVNKCGVSLQVCSAYLQTTCCNWYSRVKLVCREKKRFRNFPRIFYGPWNKVKDITQS